MQMRITVLVENNSRIDNYLLSEPALSFLLEVDKRKILFDCGYSDVFIKNAEKLNIDLNSIDNIILSHGHNDHTGGLVCLPKNKNITLIAHPNIFDKKFEDNGIEYGCPIPKSQLEKKFNVILKKDVYWITENLCYLGEIENNLSNDLDDTALVYKSQKGLIIIVGCSHSGIINILKYAQKVTGEKRIYTILGGMHLLNMSQNELSSLANDLHSFDVNLIYPCHCCDLNAKIELSKHFKIEEVCTGDVIEL